MAIHTGQGVKHCGKRNLCAAEEPSNWSAVTTAGRGCAEVDNINTKDVAGFAWSRLRNPPYTFRLDSSTTFPAQNTKRNENCMKRGVVMVPRYRPNCAAPKESEGCAPRTS